MKKQLEEIKDTLNMIDIGLEKQQDKIDNIRWKDVNLKACKKIDLINIITKIGEGRKKIRSAIRLIEEEIG